MLAGAVETLGHGASGSRRMFSARSRAMVARSMPSSARMALPCSPMRGAGVIAASTAGEIPGVRGVWKRPMPAGRRGTAPPVATICGSASQSSKPLMRSARMSAARSRSSQPSVVSDGKIEAMMSHSAAACAARAAKSAKRGSSARSGRPSAPTSLVLLRLADQRHDDPAVAGSVDAGRHVQLPRCAALEAMFDELVAEDRRRALRQTDLEIPAFAAALACVERDTESLRGIAPGQSIDDDRPDPVRRPVIPRLTDISPENACAIESVQGRAT